MDDTLYSHCSLTHISEQFMTVPDVTDFRSSDFQALEPLHLALQLFPSRPVLEPFLHVHSKHWFGPSWKISLSAQDAFRTEINETAYLRYCS